MSRGRGTRTPPTAAWPARSVTSPCPPRAQRRTAGNAVDATLPRPARRILPRMHTRGFQVGDETGVIDVWRRCDLLRPWNDPQKDIRRKLETQPEGFLV